MKRDLEPEANLVEKYAAIEPVLNERGRRLWAGAGRPRLEATSPE